MTKQKQLMSRLSATVRGLTALGAVSAAVALGGCTGQDSGSASSRADAAAISDETSGELVNLSVEGMTCQGCVYTVRQTIAKIDGVNACDVSLEESSAAVRVTDASVVPEILKAFEATSYTVRQN